MAGCTCWLAPSRWSAVILAAGIGCLMVAVFAILGNKLAAMGHFFIFSKPTGSLFGVTTCAIAVWPESWATLHFRWRTQRDGGPHQRGNHRSADPGIPAGLP